MNEFFILIRSRGSGGARGKESEYENMESEAGDSDLEFAAAHSGNQPPQLPAKAAATSSSGGVRQDSEQREIDEFEAEERRLLEEEGGDGNEEEREEDGGAGGGEGLVNGLDEDKNLSEDSKVSLIRFFQWPDFQKKKLLMEKSLEAV